MAQGESTGGAMGKAKALVVLWRKAKTLVTLWRKVKTLVTLWHYANQHDYQVDEPNKIGTGLALLIITREVQMFKS